MGKKGKERAKERRAQRLQEISELRKIPYPPLRRWWSSETVAIVTGANRGIGYEIARQLAGHGLCVILASRAADRGHKAADGLREQGLNVDSHQLDVLDAASVESFEKWVVLKYGGLDILKFAWSNLPGFVAHGEYGSVRQLKKVNNAGVNFNVGSDNSVEFAEKRLGDANLREQLLRDECLSEELIDGMVVKFIEQVKQGSWASKGWPQMFTDYSISKLAVNAYTRLMVGRFSSRPEGQKIYINCYCPGWVKTAMTAWEGNISSEEGADTGVWVVLLPSQPDITGLANLFSGLKLAQENFMKTKNAEDSSFIMDSAIAKIPLKGHKKKGHAFS